jgi:peptide/nickel transport system substrate-binding protein
MRTNQRFLGYVLSLLVLSCSTLGLHGQSISRITIGNPQPVEQLNPYTSFSVIGTTIGEYLFCSLMRPDKQTGAYLPLLAESAPRISNDGLRYTYTLHPLAKFNSGRKVLASDVVFSLKLVKNPYVNNQIIRANYDRIQDAIALDESQVIFHLSEANLEAQRVTSDFAVMPEEIFDPQHQLAHVSLAQLAHPERLSAEQTLALKRIAAHVNSFGSDLDALPATAYCGPYTVASWTSGSQIVLETNKKFWGRKLPATRNAFFSQNVEQLAFITLTSEDHTRRLLFQGELDVLSGLSPALFSDLRQIPRLQGQYSFHTPPGQAYEYIGLNMRGKEKGRAGYLDELPVRRALSHITYYELMLEKARYSLGERIVAACPSPDPSHRNTELGLPAFDPDYARELVASAGWQQESDGGLLTRIGPSGDSEVLVLECIYNAKHPYRAMIAEDLQARARQLGIIISLVELPWESYLARLQRGDFDLYIGAWDSDPNENSYDQVWHTRNWGSGSNFVGFGDAQTDALIEAYDRIEDPSGRKDLGLEIQRLQAEQQPYIFLWQETNTLIINHKYDQSKISSRRPGYWLAEWN